MRVLMILGQYALRMLTDEEKKLQEEALAAKQKKTAVKDKNKKDEAPQLTLEEIEKQKKLEELKAETARKAKEEWDKLDDQTKFYRTYEDSYKHPAIKWEKN